jgi:excisionase family DNA binding protein
MRPLLTADEVAETLQISRQRLYAWRHEGKGPRAITLEGRMLRWRADELESYLERHSDQSPNQG